MIDIVLNCKYNASVRVNEDIVDEAYAGSANCSKMKHLEKTCYRPVQGKLDRWRLYNRQHMGYFLECESDI